MRYTIPGSQDLKYLEDHYSQVHQKSKFKDFQYFQDSQKSKWPISNSTTKPEVPDAPKSSVLSREYVRFRYGPDLMTQMARNMDLG